MLGVIAALAAATALAQDEKPKSEAKKKPAPSPVLAPLADDPALPRVLLIGDSISMGYTLDVRERLINTGLVSFRFFDMPLDVHRNTWPASNAVACAADQGKFLEMHDLVFANQDRWNGEATANPKKPLQQLAGQLGIDMGKWEQCFDAQTHYPRIKANMLEGIRRGVGQTPTFIIGAKMIPGAVPFDEFKKYVEEAAAAAPKAPAKAPAKPGDR